MFLVLVGISVAQDGSIPLILLMRGDFWAWDETSNSLQRLTSWGHHQFPALSPDGRRIAYRSLAQITIDVDSSGNIEGGITPSNIEVLDIPTGEVKRVADQPPGASLFVHDVPDNWVIRSSPAWSPDGTMLTWTEFLHDSTTQLVVYNMAEETSEIILTDLPSQGFTGGISFPEVGWASEGIILDSHTNNPASPRGYDAEFLLYDTNGALLSKVSVLETRHRFIYGYRLLTYDGRGYLAVRYWYQDDNGSGYTTERWVLFDLLTGDVQPAPGQLEFYSAAAPDTSIAVTVVPVSDPREPRVLQFLDPSGNLLQEQPDIAVGDRYTLSPDGQRIAYTQFHYDTQRFDPFVIIWPDGQVIDAPEVESWFTHFIWAPIAWRIRPQVGASPASSPTAFECPGTLTPRLTVGGRGIVLEPSANNLRHLPTLSGDLVGQIPAGGEFLVGDGPVCSDGIVWWEVYYEQYFGWTAESRGRYYYVEPLL
jgi:hypothetical protein